MGLVIVVQRALEIKPGSPAGKLYISMTIKDILENNFIYKFGFKVPQSNEALEQYSYMPKKWNMTFNGLL